MCIEIKGLGSCNKNTRPNIYNLKCLVKLNRLIKSNPLNAIVTYRDSIVAWVNIWVYVKKASDFFA